MFGLCQKCLRELYGSVYQKCLVVSQSVLSVTKSPKELSSANRMTQKENYRYIFRSSHQVMTSDIKLKLVRSFSILLFPQTENFLTKHLSEKCNFSLFISVSVI